MKKRLTRIALLIFLLGAALYFFYPQATPESILVHFKGTQQTAEKFLLHDEHWQQWWPKGSTYRYVNGQPEFQYEGDTFTITAKSPTSLSLKVSSEVVSEGHTINLSPAENDMFEVKWDYSVQLSRNPFGSSEAKKGAEKLKEEIEQILTSYANFMQNEALLPDSTLPQTPIKQ